MSFFENTRKPVGLGGKIMVAMMNVGHSAVARWGLQFLNAAPDTRVLDCGCGGGANIRRLLKKYPQACRIWREAHGCHDECRAQRRGPVGASIFEACAGRQGAGLRLRWRGEHQDF